MIGRIVHRLSEALNRADGASGFLNCAILLLSHGPTAGLRREGAWVIQKQVRPSRALLNRELALTKDSDMSVRTVASAGLLTHFEFFTTDEVLDGLRHLEEVPPGTHWPPDVYEEVLKDFRDELEERRAGGAAPRPVEGEA